MVTIKSQKPIRKSYRARREGGNMTTERAVARARFAEGLPDPSANSFCRGERETWTGHSFNVAASAVRGRSMLLPYNGKTQSRLRIRRGRACSRLRRRG